MSASGCVNKMNPDELFNTLDIDKDGLLSRQELYLAAKTQGWHWRAAPFLAVFDLLTLLNPIPKHLFLQYINQIYTDPLGPYGDVLLNAPHFGPTHKPKAVQTSVPELKKLDYSARIDEALKVLEGAAGANCAGRHANFLNTLSIAKLNPDKAALLIIDPQASFTQGVWMRSIGAKAKQDVAMIKQAFTSGANLTRILMHQTEIMFTRCPFPPGSYDWDSAFDAILDLRQLYFIKPGNSVLFPPTNGFMEWIEHCLDIGRTTLVMGGCTLNSCVRVSAVEVQKQFQDRLQVVVDISLCGARVGNYLPSSEFDGFSAVESAIHQMADSGVQASRYVVWR